MKLLICSWNYVYLHCHVINVCFGVILFLRTFPTGRQGVIYIQRLYNSSFQIIFTLDISYDNLPLMLLGDLEPTFGRCCAFGANWARESQQCATFPIPVAGVPSEHQSICITAAGICCLRYYRYGEELLAFSVCT